MNSGRIIIKKTTLSNDLPLDTIVIVKLFRYPIGDVKRYIEILSKEMTYGDFLESQKEDADVSKQILYSCCNDYREVEDKTIQPSDDLYIEVYPKCQLEGTKFLKSDSDFKFVSTFEFKKNRLVEPPVLTIDTSGNDTRLVLKGCNSSCRESELESTVLEVSFRIASQYIVSGKQYRDIIANGVNLFLGNKLLCKMDSTTVVKTLKEIKDITGFDLLSDYDNKTIQLETRGYPSKTVTHTVSCINRSNDTFPLSYNINLDGNPIDSSRFKISGFNSIKRRNAVIEYSSCYNCTVNSDLYNSALQIFASKITRNEDDSVNHVENGVDGRDTKVYMLDSRSTDKKLLTTLENAIKSLSFKEILDTTGFNLLEAGEKRLDFYLEGEKKDSITIKTERKNIEINFSAEVNENRDRQYHNIIGELSHNLYTDCEADVNGEEFNYRYHITLLKSPTGLEGTWVDASNAVDNFEFKLPTRLDSNKVPAFTFDIDYSKIDTSYYGVSYSIEISNSCMTTKTVEGFKKFSV